MARTLFPLVAKLALVLPPPSWADPPAPAPQAGPLAGRWTVEFANGVAEVCEIGQDGTASVAEPRRSSGGKVTARDGAVVVTYDDDRIERWTPVGRKAVVEHWFPGSAFPSGAPVLGIARRVR